MEEEEEEEQEEEEEILQQRRRRAPPQHRVPMARVQQCTKQVVSMQTAHGSLRASCGAKHRTDVCFKNNQRQSPIKPNIIYLLWKMCPDHASSSLIWWGRGNTAVLPAIWSKKTKQKTKNKIKINTQRGSETNTAYRIQVRFAFDERGKRWNARQRFEERVAHTQPRLFRTGHRAHHHQRVLFRHDFIDFQILHSAASMTHVPSHFFIFKHTSLCGKQYELKTTHKKK